MHATSELQPYVEGAQLAVSTKVLYEIFTEDEITEIIKAAWEREIKPSELIRQAVKEDLYR